MTPDEATGNARTLPGGATALLATRQSTTRDSL